MIDLTINDEMLKVLASMKGKTLKSIEGQYYRKWEHFSEIVRFNLGQFAVEAVCDYVPVKWFWNTDHLISDEGSAFFFHKKDLKKRNYPRGWQVVQFLKDEKISEIVLVRDLIKNNHGDEILLDSGFVLRTSEKVYNFSLGSLGNTNIYFKETDRIDMAYTVKDARIDCSDPERGLLATVKRDYIFL